MIIKKKKIYLFLGCVILIIFGWIFIHPLRGVKTAPTIVPKQVRVISTTVSKISDKAFAWGKLTALEQTDISPKTSGYIQKILFKEGDFVKAGKVIIQLDNQRQKDELAFAKANAKLSRLQYLRESRAFKKGLILQDELYNAKVNDEKNQSQALASETSLNETALIAPFSGYLGAQKISVGNYVTAGEKLVSLVNDSVLNVSYALPRRVVSSLKIGQQVYLTNEFLPGKHWIAKTTFVAPEIDPNSQTIEVHALVDNATRQLKPGEYVKIEQELGFHESILLPEETLLADSAGYHVCALQHNKVIFVPVRLGKRMKGQVEILSGLSPNTLIVSEGQHQVQANDIVKISPYTK